MAKNHSIAAAGLGALFALLALAACSSEPEAPPVKFREGKVQLVTKPRSGHEGEVLSAEDLAALSALINFGERYEVPSSVPRELETATYYLLLDGVRYEGWTTSLCPVGERWNYRYRIAAKQEIIDGDALYNEDRLTFAPLHKWAAGLADAAKD